ncbi:MAG: peptide deformylase [Bacteriovoracaceae bacterium]
MSIKNLLRMGHPLLRVEAKNLSLEEILSSETKTIIEDLKECMKYYGGVGIAAPQIGISKKIAILEVLNTNPRYNITEDYPLTVFINPKITVLDSTPQGYWEGCLSVPGLRGYVERPSKIQVDFQDENGKSQLIIAQGFIATVFQHELDHLFGKLYVDHVKDTKLLSYNEEYEQFIKIQDQGSV